MWGYGGPGNWGYMMNGGYWWMGLVAMAVQLLFWVFIIWLVVYVFKKYFHSNYATRGTYSQDNALDILRERYARGEIDTEEYQMRKRDLETK